MYVDPDVALLVPAARRCGCPIRTRIGPVGQRLRCASAAAATASGARREGDEEGVALRVDLDAAVAREGLAQDAAVLGERLCVGLAPELVQQPGRALDVGEEEGDGSGGEIAWHGIMMRDGDGRGLVPYLLGDGGGPERAPRLPGGGGNEQAAGGGERGDDHDRRLR